MPNALQVEFLAAGVIDSINGLPLSGGLVNVFEAGTTTAATVWQDADKAAEFVQGFALDSQGRKAVYADGNIKFVITNTTGVTQQTLDDFSFDPASSANRTYKAVTANYTTVISDDFVDANASSGGFTVSLFTAVGNTGLELTIKKTDSTAGIIIIDPAGTETIDGTTTFSLSEQHQSIQIRSDGANWLRVDQALLGLEDYIGGLEISNGTDADHDIDMTTGICRDDVNTVLMKPAATLTKQIDAIFAEGDAAGGLDSGVVAADTLYAFWLIQRTDTGVVDALFSTSYTAPTLPANYDKKRLIGSVVTDSSSNIVAFTQVGDYFRYTGDVIADINDSTITSKTFELAAVSAPPSSVAHIYGHLVNVSSTDAQGQIWIRPNGAADGTGDLESVANFAAGGITFDQITGIADVLTNSSSQIQYAAEEATGSATVKISTYAFTMLTRSNAP